MDCGVDFYAGGVHIRLTFGFLSVWALLLLQSAFSKTAAMAFVCCALHELGHITAMKLFGIHIRGLTLYSGGVKLRSDSLALCGTLTETAVLAAGPLVNLLLGAAGCFLGNRLFAGVNISLLLFNLLPVSSLDGGRIIAAVSERLCPFCDIQKIFRISDIILGIGGAALFFMSGSVSFTLPLTMGVMILEGLIDGRR